jgi:hypothetical protein
MEWYNIVTLIVGALGGTAGVIGIYKARPEKEGIVVKNMREMLDEAHKLYDEMKSERNAVREELNEYKDETEKRFDKLETKLDKTEDTVTQLTGVINRGYGCRYPDNPSDCPVVKEYERINCIECPVQYEEK